MAKQYVVSIPGGTASTSILVTQTGILKRAVMVAVDGAAGSWELSLSGTSQISSASPDTGVLARIRLGTVLGGLYTAVFEMAVPVKNFNYLYLHCTGAGNVGELILTI